MSYDISLYADLGGPAPVSIGNLDENYTSNLSPFFEWFLEQGLRSFDGQEAWFLADRIGHGFYKISRSSTSDGAVQLEFLNRWEPENKWGSVLSAMCMLAKVWAACVAAPNAKVRVRC